MKDISEIRPQIDKLDESFKELLKERLELTNMVAEYKIKTHKPVFDHEREAEKLDAIVSDVDSGFLKRALRGLLEQIMAISRRQQYAILQKNDSEDSLGYEARDGFDFSDCVVAYQGVEGAYSHAAMKSFFKNPKKSFHVESFRKTLLTLIEKKADYCIVPIENSTAGSVEDVYDLLLEYDLSIIGEYILPIEHALLGIEGTNIDKIKTVYSHPQAIRQCEHFLSNHPNITAIAVENTAVAAKKVMEDNDPSCAAIAGEINSELYSLSILKKSIQNENDNKTRFIILSAKKEFKYDAGKLSISFELPHVKGSLYHTLSYLSYYDLNLSLIESRPIRGRNWEYRFFVDIEGNLLNEEVQSALYGLKEETLGFKILGNY